ncbi:MAG: response regulator [Gemmata sp.]
MTGIDASMFELFREEVKAHADTLGEGLLKFEQQPDDPARLEELMRAAHSIKGAARIVGIDTAVRLAHVMEDALVAAQERKIRLGRADIDVLLRGSDVLAGLAALTQDTIPAWEADNAAPLAELEPLLAAVAAGQPMPPPAPKERAAPRPKDKKQKPAAANGSAGPTLVAPKHTMVPEVVPEPAAPPPAPEPAFAFPPVPDFTPASVPAQPAALAPGHTMLDLFRAEVREHLYAIGAALPHLSADPTASDPVAECLKQLRGAARLVKCAAVADAAGALAGYLRAVRESKGTPPPPAVDWCRFAVAELAGALGTEDDTFRAWAEGAAPALATVAETFGRAAAACKTAPPPAPAGEPRASGTSHPPPADEGGPVEEAPEAEPDDELEPEPEPTPAPRRAAPAPAARNPAAVSLPGAPASEPVVRVSAHSLNRLLGLAGESLVQARWLPSFSTALLKLRKQHDVVAGMLDTAYHAAVAGLPGDQIAALVADTRREWAACRQDLGDKASDFDDHAARAEDLNARLYREVIASRMRPFGDGVHGLPRMVRDMAHALGKEARLVIVGETTEVDRDILEKLESPLSHLIRNAIDHGLESPDERTVAGKMSAGTITLEARHRSGMLLVSVSDDGSGVNLNRLREKIVERGLNTPEMVARSTEAELLEFLFLPGFSTTSEVTEFSGRGVGLDVVQDTIRKVGGNVRITTARGVGTAFHLQLPLTLSVIRAVVIDVAGEPYAFPHTRIDRLIRVKRDDVRSIEHRQFVTVDGQNVGLVMAAQLLDMPAPAPTGTEVPVVLLSDGTGVYGLVVDAFHGEQDLVVRPLDPRLGKVPNLSAAAILDDGSPVLIVDVEDLFRSMDQYIQSGSLVRCETKPSGMSRKKRVLVVDDSITVREVERQLLLHRGYEVAVAVDGMDGWNKVRAERCDLLVSDIDMQRMNGLQLVQAVRADDRLRNLPVIIVSYKEREEDRVRGLEVGANAYLTKSSFHDNRFIDTVIELIGPADADR